MISKKAAALRPYTAGEQPREKKYIKLNTNENPYPAGDKIAAALKNFDCGRLRLYPDPDCTALARAIAAKEGVDAENVFVGNGSDEVLGFAFYALFDGGIVFPDITYSFYPVYCGLHGLSYAAVPLKNDFTLSKNDYIGGKHGGIVLANPNAPTSLSVPHGDIEDIVKNAGCNVIIDEAYIDFAKSTASAVTLTRKYKNLLVVKTFSKSYSLAGIRCGYAIGSAELIAALKNTKDSFNSYPVDAVCQEVCAAAVSDTEYFSGIRKKVMKTRDNAVRELKSLGAYVLDSDTNFVFAAKEGFSGKKLYEYFKSNNVLVRHFGKDRIDNFIRVTVGTDAETEIFLDLFKRA